MSSNVEYFDCPQCGRNALRVYDLDKGYSFSCTNCDWEGEPVEETIFIVTYRGEFTCGVKARNEIEAVEKAECSIDWELLDGGLHPDMIEVERGDEI